MAASRTRRQAGRRHPGGSAAAALRPAHRPAGRCRVLRCQRPEAVRCRFGMQQRRMPSGQRRGEAQQHAIAVGAEVDRMALRRHRAARPAASPRKRATVMAAPARWQITFGPARLLQWQEWATLSRGMPQHPMRQADGPEGPERRGAAMRGKRRLRTAARPRRCRCRRGPRRPTGRWRPAARPPPLPHGASAKPPSRAAQTARQPTRIASVAGPAGHCCRSGCSGISAAPAGQQVYPEACRNDTVAERRDEGRAGGSCHAPGQARWPRHRCPGRGCRGSAALPPPQPLGSGYAAKVRHALTGSGALRYAR